MSSISITELYDVLCNKFDKETAKSLTTFIESKMNADLENKTQHLATKEDLANTKVDLLRWIFAFWVTLALLIIGLYLKS